SLWRRCCIATKSRRWYGGAVDKRNAFAFNPRLAGATFRGWGIFARFSQFDFVGHRVVDKIDRKILTLLQRDATMPVAEIGRKVGLSTTPCWRRIQKMEEDGVIKRRVA